MPSDAKPGDYILRVVASYDNKKAVATFPVKILPKIESNKTEEDCFDGIKNQNEEDIDCGGVCGPCKILDCNDDDICTDDKMENGKCANTPIKPCCGNNICEEEENENCAKDCGEEPAEPTLNLDDIKKTAKYDPAKASQQCNQIEIPDLKDTCISSIGEVQKNKNYCTKILSSRIKDLCYSNIAKLANDNSICQDISSDGIRDSCYMTFVLDNDDYSVCGKIVNKALRQSCESLRQLHELNQ